MWVVLNSQSTSWNPVERLLFPAPATSYGIDSFPDELILIPREDGAEVPCLFMPFKHARFLIIYFHANAEDLGLCHGFCRIMRELFQVHVLAVEYPGYGICPGKTDEEGILENAHAALQFATQTLKWPCDGIKLFGRSLGTGPAIALATQYDVAGVILISPFTSIKNLFRSQVGPLAEFVGDRFRNCELASQIASSTLIIHGQQDTLVPLEHGRRIYDALTTRKMMVCPAGMGHNTSLLRNVGTFVLPMTQFFSLPDYTFEDIEVPDWVFPVRRPSSPGPTEDDEAAQELSGIATSLGLREDLTGGTRACRQGASRGLWTAAVPPLRAASLANEVTEEARSDVWPEVLDTQPVMEREDAPPLRPKLSPRHSPEGGGSGGGGFGLKVSRQYDFCAVSPRASNGPQASPRVMPLPEEMLSEQLDDRTSWQVERVGGTLSLPPLKDPPEPAEIKVQRTCASPRGGRGVAEAAAKEPRWRAVALTVRSL